MNFKTLKVFGNNNFKIQMISLRSSFSLKGEDVVHKLS